MVHLTASTRLVPADTGSFSKRKKRRFLIPIRFRCNDGMILSHAHKFIFLKTRKTAGTSIELALSGICGPQDVITPVTAADEHLREGRGPQNWDIRGDWQTELQKQINPLIGRRTRPTFYNHIPARKVRRIVGPETWNSYFRFTVERNPWDSHVSRYFWKYRDTQQPPRFESYIRSLRGNRPISNFTIYTIGDRIAVDYICQYDRLEADLGKVLERVGLKAPLTLPRAKGYVRTDRRHWREFYSPETRDIIAEIYAREISFFGYTFS